jgi:hypothetical protein
MDSRGQIEELEVSVMAKLIFKGWRIGMRKVAFTRLLSGQPGLSLKQAQNIKLKVLDNEIVEYDIEDINLAKTIASEAEKLGVITDLME